MLRFIAIAGIGALIAGSSLAASAQTTAPPSASPHQTHQPTGSHRSEMRQRHNMPRERARASAEHMRQMRNQ